MTNSLTISGLAVRTFIKDFYKYNIPHIFKASMYKEIKQGLNVAKHFLFFIFFLVL